MEKKLTKKQLQRELRTAQEVQVAVGQAIAELIDPEMVPKVVARAKEIHAEIKRGNLCVRCQEELNG